MMKKLFLMAALLGVFVLCAAEKVVAEWDFSKGLPGGAYIGTLREDAKLDGGLVNVARDGKKAGGFQVSGVRPELAPSEGFRLEFDFSTDGFGKARNMALYDNQYVNYPHKNPAFNRGVMCYLVWRPQSRDYVPYLSLGFGGKSEAFRGTPFPNEPGKRHKLVWEFNGVNTVRSFLDGKPGLSWSVKALRGVAPATQSTVIGDRVGSGFNPFDGKIYSVKLTAFPKPEMSLLFDAPGRRAFVRNEKNAALETMLSNTIDQPLEKVELSGSIAGKPIASKTLNIPAGKTVVFSLPVETRFKVGSYPVELSAAYERNGAKHEKKLNFDLFIGPVSGDFFPIVIWGYNLNGLGFEPFQQVGFTHGTDWGYTATFFRWPDLAPDMAVKKYRILDRMLAQGFRGMDSLAVNAFSKANYPRLGRDGKPYPDAQTDASNPELRRQVAELLEKSAAAYKTHPAYDGMLINSEVRDSSLPSFGEHSKADYKKATGQEIPQAVEEKLAPHYSGIRNFPVSRVIPENDPLLTFYRWFWREGDGWNPMQTLASRVSKKAIGRPFWTFYDPATRVPPLWGSGGDVDYISHWTYAYPDPISVGVNTDEMFAMRRGNPDQGVMNMTQIICYRSVTAPAGKKVPNEPAWVKEYPTAPYITLPPDLMRIAVWTQISRHVSGIMFHGYNSLLVDPATKGNKGYQCTNLKTKEVLTELFRDVVKPLAPVLKRIPEPAPEIASLQSFPSAIFAGRATWGWSGWGFHSNLMMHYANLQPGVIFDEEILRDGFGKLKVLVMPHCDVLTEPVFKAVTEFQKKGGIIVGDSKLVPGITPDITWEEVKRTGEPAKDSAAFRAAGMELRKKLSGVWKPRTESSSPDIVTHLRSDKGADFLFAVNDKRTFGEDFGPYGLVQEKGLANSGTVTLDRVSGAVYDLVKHAPVKFAVKEGRTVVPVEFAPGEGKLLLFLPEAVGGVELTAPAQAERGEAFEFTVAVKDAKGKKISTLLPLEITVTSPEGKTDDSMPGALVDGIFRRKVVAPLNGKAGNWKIHVRDLASGLGAEKTIGVK